MKIFWLAVLAAAVPMLVFLGETTRLKATLSEKAAMEMNAIALNTLNQVARNVYGLCETANDLIQDKVNISLNVAREVINRHGTPNLASKTVTWEVINQLDKKTRTLPLARFIAGKTELEPNRDLHIPTPIVDEVKKLVGGTCTIFQRMDEEGNMLRVATNVQGADGKRAIGTYIPAVNPDGSRSTVISSVMAGNVYRGLAFVVNAWYLTAYEPLRDEGGKVVGMLYVGEKVEAVSSLRQAILKVRVGKTGYVGVLGGKGDHRGKYIISKDGTRDGEALWDAKDNDGRSFIQSLVNGPMALPPGEVHLERYFWQNPGEPAPRAKKSVSIYFQPWDWVIFVGAYEDEFFSSVTEFTNVIDSRFKNLAAFGFVILLFTVFLAGLLGNTLTKPLHFICELAKMVAEGNLAEVRPRIAAYGYLEVTLQEGNGPLNQGNLDEIGSLLVSFQAMTQSLNSLIGQVHRSGIQVSASATQISASARQLEATVAEQAASIKEVTVTSKEISTTSEELARTITKVGTTVNETAGMTATGRTSLNTMEATLRELVQATGLISTKLAVINEKTNKISGVVTTINKISDQTNLLSLNAAIEAEKAGEYGRGFSVVAREISRLADQTAVATQDIEQMVKEMQGSVSTGVMEMDKFTVEVKSSVDQVADVGRQLGRIIDQVLNLGPQFENVEHSTQNQAQGAHQISEAMSQLSTAAEQDKDALREFKKVTGHLNEAVQGLHSEVSRFKIAE
jgi:methyl-accepting chemotaxis protein WspA